jgi:hypothetical protein
MLSLPQKGCGAAGVSARTGPRLQPWTLVARAHCASAQNPKAWTTRPKDRGAVAQPAKGCQPALHAFAMLPPLDGFSILSRALGGPRRTGRWSGRWGADRLHGMFRHEHRPAVRRADHRLARPRCRRVPAAGLGQRAAASANHVFRRVARPGAAPLPLYFPRHDAPGRNRPASRRIPAAPSGLGQRHGARPWSLVTRRLPDLLPRGRS